MSTVWRRGHESTPSRSQSSRLGTGVRGERVNDESNSPVWPSVATVGMGVSLYVTV
jgi:hypothetical protein